MTVLAITMINEQILHTKTSAGDLIAALNSLFGFDCLTKSEEQTPYMHYVKKFSNGSLILGSLMVPEYYSDYDEKTDGSDAKFIFSHTSKNLMAFNDHFGFFKGNDPISFTYEQAMLYFVHEVRRAKIVGIPENRIGQYVFLDNSVGNFLITSPYFGIRKCDTSTEDLMSLSDDFDELATAHAYNVSIENIRLFAGAPFEWVMAVS